jgi:hypothetical protein
LAPPAAPCCLFGPCKKQQQPWQLSTAVSVYNRHTLWLYMLTATQTKTQSSLRNKSKCLQATSVTPALLYIRYTMYVPPDPGSR